MSIKHINQIEIRCEDCDTVIQVLSPNSSITWSSATPILCGACGGKRWTTMPATVKQ